MLGYLQRVSGPQILRESRRRIEDTTEPKKKKMGNKFCILELKPLILNNYYFTQLDPFPKYCHIWAKLLKSELLFHTVIVSTN